MGTLAGTASFILGARPETSAAAAAPPRLRITNVRVFDGISDVLRKQDVIVHGDKITAVGATDAAEASPMQVLDGGGRVLIPGLIDTHMHLTINASPAEMMNFDVSYLGIRGAVAAKQTLLRGFTSIRDAGGPTVALKSLVDQGVVPGPRIYPSAAMISQTSGHGDFRFNTERNPRFGGGVPGSARSGLTVIADGVDDMLAAVREQLKQGASQIKLMAGGGASSHYDPLDTVQFTPDELRAAVAAAENWNTYVLAHAYNSRSIRQCLQAGVKSIEHGHLMDEDTMRMLVDRDAFLSTQMLTFLSEAADRGEANLAKTREIRAGMDRMLGFARKHGAKITFSTDLMDSLERQRRQSEEFSIRKEWFSSPDILRQATSVAADLLALSGGRDPYPGKLGVVTAGAYADLLIVDGNPLEDASVLADPSANLKLIMKGGSIYKDELS
ncbi:amidohydrolase family protein [Geminicoccaceae bacterium 1502E]|nr:amidohydrolase family protein [Geminicoccaceae bacterium 1502E]